MFKVSRPYVLLIGCYVGRGYFVVGGEHIAMAMVVVDHGSSQHYLRVIGKYCLMLFVLPWQHVTLLVKCW